MTITVVLHDPVNIGHEIAPGFIERLVNFKLGFFDDKRSLLPARLQGKVEVSSNWFPTISLDPDIRLTEQSLHWT
jgi:hypothetical protein